LPQSPAAGDTLIVWKLDRFGRSLRDLITMVDELRTQGVQFRSLIEHGDTETAAGRTMWQMIGVMAAIERSLSAERTRTGVQAAKSRGGKCGRKPTLTPPQITPARQQIDQGRTVKEVAALLNVHRMTISCALAVP